jgi:hypothetical protein
MRSPQRVEAITARQRIATSSPSLLPTTATHVLLCVAGCLTVAHLAVQGARYLWGAQIPEGLVRLFSLDSESNIPTWFSSSMLLVCALLLGLIAAVKKGANAREVRAWGSLALIFLGLSLDETATLHELTIRRLRSALNAEGILYFTWVVPGAAFVLTVVVVYFRFFLQFPPATRLRFLIAGATFVGGALGMEMAGAPYYVASQGASGLYMALYTIEEVCEMLGLILFIRALLLYMDTHLEAGRILPFREGG